MIPQHRRRSIRLKGYDYTRLGPYFVTLVTWHRQHRFGSIVDGQMICNGLGRLVAALWQALPLHFPMQLDEWVLMPNHLHAVLYLHPTASHRPTGTLQLSARQPARPGDVTGQPNGTTPGSLGAILQNFKSVSARRANRLERTPGSTLWQRDYYDHIVRDDQELDRIRAYIRTNPDRWELDRLRSTPQPLGIS